MTPQELITHFHHAGLEGLDSDDLTSFVNAAQNPILLGRLLFPTRPKKFTEATTLLAGYASRIAAAQGHRKRGAIPTALRLEDAADVIYNQLPEYAKW